MTRRATRPLHVGLLASALTASVLLALAATGYGATKARKPGVPVAATGDVHTQGASTTLLGAVNPRGAATTYYFQYGPTIAYGKQTAPATLPAGSATVKVGQPATGLVLGYHYRLVASNSYGTKLGADRTYATKGSSRTKFKLLEPAEAPVYGSSLVLRGALTGAGAAGSQVELQASPYPYLTSFATIGAPVTTNAAGAFSFPIARLLTSTQYRVSTLGPRPFYSQTLTVQVAYRVTLKVKTSKHRGLVRLYGTVTPAAVGARVLIQLDKKVRPGDTEKTEERTTRFATAFATTTKRGTKAVSRFSTIVKVSKGGAYRARVQPVKKGAYASGNSPTVLLHSAPK